MSKEVENFRDWLTPLPQSLGALELTAITAGCIKQLSAENWDEDVYQEYAQELVMQRLHMLSNFLVLLKNYEETGDIFSPETYIQFNVKHIDLFNSKEFNSAIESWNPFLKRRANLFWDALEFEVKLNANFYYQALRIHEQKCYTLNDLDNRFEASFTKPMPERLRQIIQEESDLIRGLLNTRNHPSSQELIQRVYSPKNGPKDAYSLYLLGFIIMRDLILLEEKGEEIHHPFRPTLDVLENLLYNLQILIDDAPHDILREKISEDIKYLTSTDIPQNYHFHLAYFVGFTRYYAIHNAEKIPTIYLAEIIRAQLALASLAINFGNDGDPDYTSIASLSLSDAFIEYERPTPDKVAETFRNQARSENVISKSAQRTIESFERIRSMRPAFMEETVMFYNPDPEFMRKLRRNVFKARQLEDGIDGPKTEFLKKVAFTKTRDLIRLGLPLQKVFEMAHDGKIPLDDLGRKYPISVDHIVDREFGGVNRDHNFVILPEDINKQKDFLKKIQMAELNRQGGSGWIITWTPKKLSNGQYPLVYGEQEYSM